MIQILLKQNKKNLRESQENIARVRKERLNLKEDTNRTIDNLVSERDEACEERYKARVQYDEVKKKLQESEEELTKAKKEYEKQKELTDDTINSLVAERDDDFEEKDTFQTKYKASEKKLKQIEEEIIKIKNEHRRLKEHTDIIIDKLIIERDEASEKRYMARVQCDEIKEKINNAEDELLEARKEKNKLMEDTDDIMNSLTAERDENCEERHNFQSEYEESEGILDGLMNKRNGDTKAIRLESDASSRKSRDSGINIDIESFTELIDERLDERMDLMINKKMEKLVRAEEFGWNKIEFEERITRTNKVSTTTESDDAMHEKIDPRARNIIIHGIKVDKGKEHDGRIVAELFRNVMVSHVPNSIDRLGMKKTDKSRPIRIIMRTEKEKLDFMSNLGRLKYGIDDFKKISITDDYTLEERAIINKWVKIAETRNTNNESDYTWKVRGSPKHEMRLIKIHKIRK